MPLDHASPPPIQDDRRLSNYLGLSERQPLPDTSTLICLPLFLES